MNDKYKFQSLLSLNLLFFCYDLLQSILTAADISYWQRKTYLNIFEEFSGKVCSSKKKRSYNNNNKSHTNYLTWLINLCCTFLFCLLNFFEALTLLNYSPPIHIRILYNTNNNTNLQMQISIYLIYTRMHQILILHELAWKWIQNLNVLECRQLNRLFILFFVVVVAFYSVY